MAYTSSRAANTASAAADQNDSWKARGFINFYLPTKDGGKKKLGSIPLKLAKANEKELAEYLEASEENQKKFMNALMMEYNSAEPQAGSAFAL